MKMKAAVMRVQGKPRPYAVNQPMTIETVDLDPPGPGEVLYKIIGAGLCHSDLSTIENLLIKIPGDVPLEDATIFGCAVVTGMGAVLRQVLRPHA